MTSGHHRSSAQYKVGTCTHHQSPRLRGAARCGGSKQHRGPLGEIPVRAPRNTSSGASFSSDAAAHSSSAVSGNGACKRKCSTCELRLSSGTSLTRGLRRPASCWRTSGQSEHACLLRASFARSASATDVPSSNGLPIPSIGRVAALGLVSLRKAASDETAARCAAEKASSNRRANSAPA